MKPRRARIASFALLSLAACSSRPAADLYVLRVPEGTVASCSPSRTISIDRPSVPNEYDSKRIAVLLDHHHLTYYTGAAWASPFPEQLQDFLSDALMQQGQNVADGDAIEAIRIHLVVQEADITDLTAPVVHLRLTGSIHRPSGAMSHFKVNEAVPAAENHMPAIIDAYDRAALNAASEISKAMKLHCSGA